MSKPADNPQYKTGWRIGKWAAAMLLTAVIIGGGIIIASKYDRGNDLEISLSSGANITGRIYVGGNVSNPGFYPLRKGDGVADVLSAAGGLTGGDDAYRLELYVSGQDNSPQKININRAEAWLLAALPGIGETRAQAIIDYREANGLFRDIDELLKVTGIGVATLEVIRGMITVNE